MNNKPVSLFKLGNYSQEWVRPFYVQSDIWWGADAGEEYYPGRLQTIERLCGAGGKRILELGAGSGALAAMLARAGHRVSAVELTDAIRPAQSWSQEGWEGSLQALEADFYTLALAERFDVICYWDGFGVGSDADQRRLLRRIGREWLAPGGCALIDVFSPLLPAQRAGSEELLAPLAGVPGSVEMRRRCHFDPLHSRWIDEWVPTAAPEEALAQTVRCYTPVDFALLLEGTGLRIKRIEVDGVEVDRGAITISGPLMTAWSYLVQVVGEK